MLNVIKRKKDGLMIAARYPRYCLDSNDLETIIATTSDPISLINTAFYLGLVQGRKIGKREGLNDRQICP